MLVMISPEKIAARAAGEPDRTDVTFKPPPALQTMTPNVAASLPRSHSCEGSDALT